MASWLGPEAAMDLPVMMFLPLYFADRILPFYAMCTSVNNSTLVLSIHKICSYSTVSVCYWFSSPFTPYVLLHVPSQINIAAHLNFDKEHIGTPQCYWENTLWIESWIVCSSTRGIKREQQTRTSMKTSSHQCSTMEGISSFISLEILCLFVTLVKTRLHFIISLCRKPGNYFFLPLYVLQ